MRKIRSVKKLQPEVQQCLVVSSKDHLYETNEEIITHNSPATVYTQTLCAWSQKKGSELLLEPFVQILEQAPYFQKVRRHEDLVEASKHEDTADHICWTTSALSSALAMQNGVNYKLISEAGGLLGQAQPLDELIKLPNDEYKPMGEIKTGDYVASPTQGKTKVLGTYPQGKQKSYSITLADGRKVRCNANHLWTVSKENDNNGRPIFKVVTTKYLIEHLDEGYCIPDENDCVEYYKEILKAELDFELNRSQH